MCLIVFAWNIVPDTPLIAAANRDEYYDRPAAPAHWWEDHPQVYGGRDLRGGGTWLGVAKNGRFAAVTNIYAAQPWRDEATSRGMLAADFLTGLDSPEIYIAQLRKSKNVFNGFNLLVGDAQQLIWYSNCAVDDARNGELLLPGIYGLASDQLDAPWPKIVRTKAQFASMLCQGASEEAYFEMLGDTSRASDCRLPKTSIGLEMERALSAVCIESPQYGTRCSSLVCVRADRSVSLQERAIH